MVTLWKISWICTVPETQDPHPTLTQNCPLCVGRVWKLFLSLAQYSARNTAPHPTLAQNCPFVCVGRVWKLFFVISSKLGMICENQVYILTAGNISPKYNSAHQLPYHVHEMVTEHISAHTCTSADNWSHIYLQETAESTHHFNPSPSGENWLHETCPVLLTYYTAAAYTRAGVI